MELNIYSLEDGVVYIVTKPFKDHYSNEFSTGEHLTYVSRNFSLYHGGFTITFKEKTLYLQEDVNRDIIDSFDSYFQIHDASRRVIKPASPPEKKKNKRWENFGNFLLCLLFVFAGAWIIFINDEQRIIFIIAGWFGMIFFGLGALVFLRAMFKN